MIGRFGALEWAFTAALIVLVAAAAPFGLFVVQLFRNPSRRAR
jgi:hypothetical protein